MTAALSSSTGRPKSKATGPILELQVGTPGLGVDVKVEKWAAIQQFCCASGRDLGKDVFYGKHSMLKATELAVLLRCLEGTLRDPTAHGEVASTKLEEGIDLWSHLIPM